MSAVLTCFFVVGINLEKAAQYWPSWDFEGSSCWWLEVLPSEVPPLRPSFRCQQTIWRWNLQFSLGIFESTCWNSPSQIQLQTSCAHTLKLKNSTDTSAAYMSQMSLKMICHSTEPTILFCSLQEVCLQEKSLRCRILQKMSRSNDLQRILASFQVSAILTRARPTHIHFVPEHHCDRQLGDWWLKNCHLASWCLTPSFSTSTILASHHLNSVSSDQITSKIAIITLCRVI